MKRTWLAALGLAGLLSAAALAVEVKVTGIHNCCPGCADAIKKAVDGSGGKETKLEGTNLSFQADDPQPTLRALFMAGYAGKVEGGRAPGMGRGIRDLKAKSFKVEGVHNCCGACSKAINEALKAVGKVEIKAKENFFTISSDTEIEAAAVLRALRAAGINGRIMPPAQ